MIRYFRHFLLILGGILLIGLVAWTPVHTFAFDLFKQSCSGSGSSSGICSQANSQGTTNPISGPGGVISTAANVVAIVTGIIAVIMIIVSGFMFVTAGGASPGQRSGDPNAIKKARSTLIGAIVGLVIVALAWSITRFVIDRVVQ